MHIMQGLYAKRDRLVNGKRVTGMMSTWVNMTMWAHLYQFQRLSGSCLPTPSSSLELIVHELSLHQTAIQGTILKLCASFTLAIQTPAFPCPFSASIPTSSQLVIH